MTPPITLTPRLCLSLIIFAAAGCGDGVPFDQRAEVDDVGWSSRDLPGPSEPDESQRQRMFLFRNGTLGKIRSSSQNETRTALEVADDECATEAARRGYDGTWKAWLSSSEVSVMDRIATEGPWYRVDRKTLLFGNKSEFLIGPRAAIQEDEGGREQQFWSGTDRSGRPSGANCADWTEYVRLLGTVNRADRAGAAWWVDAPISCGNYLALACIED